MAPKIPSFLKNHYFIALVAFGIWITVFDQNNLIRRYHLIRSYRALEREKTFYEDEIRKDSTMLHSLEADSAELERFAREEYLMKRDHEDVFLIIPEER
ncbi:MAG: hypothetical protein JW861_11315 [Bacteroidales bacterium]|nr:hypothetical protein [Bacteroidales bacterium]